MRKKILVVDDSPSVLAMLDDMLAELNYEVTTSDNGLDACRHLETDQYNMIITDLHMPRMCGIELSQRARKIPNCRFVPIVMISSEEDDTKIAQAKQMGISTFLQKPIKEKQLKTIMQVVLGA